MNFVPARVAACNGNDAQLEMPDGQTLTVSLIRPVNEGESVTVGIRPEHIALAKVPGSTFPSTVKWLNAWQQYLPVRPICRCRRFQGAHSR